MQASVYNIPTFIKASSPRGLARLALSEQTRVGGQIIWLGAPVYDGKSWYLWYVLDAKQTLLSEGGE